jgi:hypothetical protein
MAHTRRLARAALCSAALAAVSVSRLAGSAEPGPVSVTANEFEYRRHDAATGEALLEVRADHAQAAGDAIALRVIRITRFHGGREALHVRAASGFLSTDGGAVLDGGVDVRLRVERAESSFACATIRVDAEDGAVSSDSVVTGRIRSGRDGAPDGAAIDVRIRGTGLSVSVEGQSAQIRRAVTLEVEGAAQGPWAIAADGGLSVTAQDGATVLRLAGPVEGRGRALAWSSDGAEMVLVASDTGDLRVGRVFASGNVHVQGESDGLAVPAGDGPARYAADAGAVEATPGGVAILMGTIVDPASLVFEGGRFRGTSIRFADGCVRSSGGATSVFEWRHGR